MLSFPSSLKVFLALEPCDMRKGFEGLTALVAGRLQENLRGGALFVFCNKTRTRLKVIYFDGSGLWLLCKRLEKGRFSWPQGLEEGAVKLKLRPEALAMLTDSRAERDSQPKAAREAGERRGAARSNIELRGARMLPWHERE